MKKALSCEGLGLVKDLDELVELAAGIGFDKIDVPPVLLRKKLQCDTVENIEETVRKKGVGIGSFPFGAWWLEDERTFVNNLLSFYEDVKNYSRLGCKLSHTFIMPSTDEQPSILYKTAARRLRIIADILECFDMKLALEYVGPKHMRLQHKFPFIWNSSQTLDWIRYINRPNVGLLLDTFHWYCAGETLSDISRIPTEYLFHVHVNDAPDILLEEQRDNQRLYCGDGIIPLKDFMGQLRKMGYQGIVAQEVLGSAFPGQDNETLALKTKDTFKKYLNL